jgi:hypothetical protein
MTVIPIFLGAIATVFGIWYAVLGVQAIKYLHNADQIDKAVGWSLWWCFDLNRYDEEGRRLCKKGQLLAFAAAALWIAVYAVKWN